MPAFRGQENTWALAALKQKNKIIQSKVSTQVMKCETSVCTQETILRLFNLQLRRQRCSWLERFS
jgi:hypothetical protein